MRHYADRGDSLVALLELDELDTLSVASLLVACISDSEADGDATLVDNHEVFVALHALNGNDLARLLSDIERGDTLRATTGEAIATIFNLHIGGAVFTCYLSEHTNLRAFAEALLRDYHE